MAKHSYSNTTTISVLVAAVAIVQGSKQLNGFSLCTAKIVVSNQNCSFLQFVYKRVELSGHTNGSSALK